MGSKNGRTFDIHPSRHMSRFGAKPQRQKEQLDVALIEMLRQHKDDVGRVVWLVDELLKLRERASLPLDVQEILGRYGR